MRFEASVNTAAVTRAMIDVQRVTFPNAQRLFREIAKKFTYQITKQRLSGRPGLIGRTGSLAGSLIFKTTGSNVKTLETKVGFLEARSAMIARVHELGTVGAGGLLPDIVPKTKPFLAFPVRDPKAAVGKIQGWVFTKKVSIPPRLGYFEHWRKFKADDVQQLIRQAEKGWVSGKR